MPSPKKDRFLNEVLSYIKFPFDRAEIKFELETHILDKTDNYIEQGHDEEAAEQLAIQDMGDPKTIGIGLNKEHNPILGWMWGITNIIVVILGVFTIYVVGVSLSGSFGSSVMDIPKSNMAYKLDINEKARLDDRIIRFTNVIYEKNGNMNIIYEYYNPKFWTNRWTLGGMGEISDNLGNVYRSGSGIISGGGLRSKGRKILKSFSSEADTLIINYDSYNRKYKIEVPLRAGDNNE